MSDTLCGLPYEDCDEASVVWKEKRVKTRKEHRCVECDVKIPVGEAGGKADSLYDGYWTTHYRCAACLILSERVATITGECAQWGNLGEYIREVANQKVERYDEALDEYVDGLPSPEEHRKLWEAA